MQRIYPVQNRRTVTQWIDSPDKWDFAPARRLTKKQRQRASDAVATLKGFGYLKRRRIEHETVETFTVDSEKLERFIMENHYDILSRFGVRDNMVLIGARQWQELFSYMLSQPTRINMADFSVSGRRNRLHGLMIVILPWMEGTVLVPKEYLPIETERVAVPMTAEQQQQRYREAEGLRAAYLWNREMGRNPLD